MRNAELTNNEEICEVVKEVREMRRKLSAEFGHNRDRLYAHYRAVEKELRKSGKYKFTEPPDEKTKHSKSANVEAAD